MSNDEQKKKEYITDLLLDSGQFFSPLLTFLIYYSKLLYYFFFWSGSLLICCQTGCRALPVTECLGFSCVETWCIIWNVYQILQSLLLFAVFLYKQRKTHLKNSFSKKEHPRKNNPECIFVELISFIIRFLSAERYRSPI